MKEEVIAPLSTLNKFIKRQTPKYEVGDEIMIDIEEKVYTKVDKVEDGWVWFYVGEAYYNLLQEDINLHLIKKAKKAKPLPFGFGLFIRNDDFGKPCYVGDTIECTYPRMDYNSFMDRWERKEDTVFTGTLVLLKSKGVMIRSNKSLHPKYYKPTLIKHSLRICKWRKL